jgi:hypothetical protein
MPQVHYNIKKLSLKSNNFSLCKCYFYSVRYAPQPANMPVDPKKGDKTAHTIQVNQSPATANNVHKVAPPEQHVDKKDTVPEKSVPQATTAPAPNGPKEAALAAIQQFKNDSSKTSIWSKIDKNKFADQLTAFIKNPDLMNQADTNLCGPAASCKIAAELAVVLSVPSGQLETLYEAFESPDSNNVRRWQIECLRTTPFGRSVRFERSILLRSAMFVASRYSIIFA